MRLFYPAPINPNQLSGISETQLDVMENGRMGELGYSKINNILTVLGLKLQEASARRPTL